MSEWIKISDKWEVRRDNHNWILREWYEGLEAKTKLPKMHNRETYHPNLRQVAYFVMDKAYGECPTLESIIELHDKPVGRICGFIRGLVSERGYIDYTDHAGYWNSKREDRKTMENMT